MLHLLLAIIYLSFISLGLPDSLLGSAWPVMYPELSVPVSYAGIISMIIAIGTVVSSLQSDKLTWKLGTGKVTAISVATTAIALGGFSVTHSFPGLCLWAIPYGLGAGSVDASLNNYVALHYSSRQMSWLHCMWGIGASTGPYIMGFALTGGQSWNMGYRYIAILQVMLTAILLFSLPLWKKRITVSENVELSKTVSDHEAIPSQTENKPLSLREIVKIHGAKEVMIMFFCYSALEQTAGLWASSYFVLCRGLETERAAGMAALFFVGITLGRFISGFMTMHFSDPQMIRIGEGLILFGIIALLLPLGEISALAGIWLIGLGCAPVYPCIIHSTPMHFGAERSQALIGVQMASAYIGTCMMPPIFGFLASHSTTAILPVYLIVILLIMAAMHEKLEGK
ncbi:MAG: MFS transporter [Lachnospiraceae bacterium]|nr:MFS transporter [Lachnospiraceae bacterium]